MRLDAIWDSPTDPKSTGSWPPRAKVTTGCGRLSIRSYKARRCANHDFHRPAPRCGRLTPPNQPIPFLGAELHVPFKLRHRSPDARPTAVAARAAPWNGRGAGAAGT